MMTKPFPYPKDERAPSGKRIITPHRAGLFSNLNKVITVFEQAARAEMYVDWRGMEFYGGDGTENVYEYLFTQNVDEPLDGERDGGWPHWHYTWRCVAKLYGTRGWRERLHHWWRKLQVHAHLTDEAEAFLKPWQGQRITGAHVRNNQHAAEQPSGTMPQLAHWFACLEEQAGDGLIYLATDNEEAVSEFRERFGNRLLVREIPRAGNLQTEFHLNFRQTRRDVEECFLDALILARCSRLVHTVSNLATAVLYMNPGLESHYLTAQQPPRPAASPPVRRFSKPPLGWSPA